jgi:hypothetical protein
MMLRIARPLLLDLAPPHAAVAVAALFDIADIACIQALAMSRWLGRRSTRLGAPLGTHVFTALEFTGPECFVAQTLIRNE